MKKFDQPISAIDALIRRSHTRAAAQHAASHGRNAKLLTGRPKAIREAPVNKDMHHVKDGVTYTGVTMTTSKNVPVADAPSPMDSTVQGKHLTPPRAVPGMRSRHDEAAPELPGVAAKRNAGHGVDCALGAAVMAEGHAGLKTKRHAHELPAAPTRGAGGKFAPTPPRSFRNKGVPKP